MRNFYESRLMYFSVLSTTTQKKSSVLTVKDITIGQINIHEGRHKAPVKIFNVHDY
jgi:hypothetical protein